MVYTCPKTDKQTKNEQIKQKKWKISKTKAKNDVVLSGRHVLHQIRMFYPQYVHLFSNNLKQL